MNELRQSKVKRVFPLNLGRTCRISKSKEFSIRFVICLETVEVSLIVENTQTFSPSQVPSSQADVNYIGGAQKMCLWTLIKDSWVMRLNTEILMIQAQLQANVELGKYLKYFLSRLAQAGAQKWVIPGQDNGQRWWGVPIPTWCWVLCSWASLRQSYICCWRIAAYGDPACQAHVVNLSSLIVPVWGFLK